MPARTDPLPSWRDTATRSAIAEFVESVTRTGGTGFVPPEERVATFDNDGTLWCEKPMPIELGFILQRLAAMADHDPALRDRQPWKAAHDHIASGGDRDFMRPITEPIYGIPFERVIGSSNALRYEPDEHGGQVVYLAEPDYFDDGPAKPVRIWSRVGRQPILAAGNSNGDIPMLQFAAGPARPGLRLLVLHDDAEREFDYTAGAEQALNEAKANNWTVVSIKHDWMTVFNPGG